MCGVLLWLCWGFGEPLGSLVERKQEEAGRDPPSAGPGAAAGPRLPWPRQGWAGGAEWPTVGTSAWGRAGCSVPRRVVRAGPGGRRPLLCPPPAALSQPWLPTSEEPEREPSLPGGWRSCPGRTRPARPLALSVQLAPPRPGPVLSLALGCCLHQPPALFPGPEPRPLQGQMTNDSQRLRGSYLD